MHVQTSTNMSFYHMPKLLTMPCLTGYFKDKMPLLACLIAGITVFLAHNGWKYCAWGIIACETCLHWQMPMPMSSSSSSEYMPSLVTWPLSITTRTQMPSLSGLGTKLVLSHCVCWPIISFFNTAVWTSQPALCGQKLSYHSPNHQNEFVIHFQKKIEIYHIRIQWLFVRIWRRQ